MGAGVRAGCAVLCSLERAPVPAARRTRARVGATLRLPALSSPRRAFAFLTSSRSRRPAMSDASARKRQKGLQGQRIDIALATNPDAAPAPALGPFSTPPLALASLPRVVARALTRPSPHVQPSFPRRSPRQRPPSPSTPRLDRPHTARPSSPQRRTKSSSRAATTSDSPPAAKTTATRPSPSPPLAAHTATSRQAHLLPRTRLPAGT